jgi:uncharacterized protein DUF5925/ATPase family protein associated with various cellular activities (AAA)
VSELPLPPLVWPLSDRGLTQRLVDLASMSFITGSQPFARQAFFSDVHTIEPLTPADAVVDRELVLDTGDHHRLLRGQGWSAHLVLVARRPEVQALVTGETAALADEIMSRIRAAVPAPERPNAQERVTLWAAGTNRSPTRHRRWIDTPRWATIERNYPHDVASVLAELLAMPGPPQQTGRLLLWYGDAGTGKTTAIRALAHEWSPWADVHFVLDPEAFFGSPDYLMQVVADEDMWDPRWASMPGRWKVLVVEDADELIRADARNESGAALGRLLNLSDGILGYGLRALLLITTNEAMRGLNPAVVRPGRCLADVQFRRFSHQEALVWLDGAGRVPSSEVTLAELYQARGDLHSISNPQRPPTTSTYL